jgi:hypothetical protein
MKIIKAIDLIITNDDNAWRWQEYQITHGHGIDCSINGDGYGTGDVSGKGDMVSKDGDSLNFFTVVSMLDNIRMRK